VGEFHESLQHIKRLGITARRVKLMGGEPTLHPDIDQLCAAAKAAGVGPVHVVTNGTLLHRMSPSFWTAVDAVRVSVYPQTKATWPDEFADKIRARNIRTFREMFTFQRNDDPALIERIWTTCKVRNSCFGVAGGRFYKCMRAAFLGRLLPLPHDDGVPLATATTQRLLDYIQDDRPLAACSHCTGSLGKPFPHQQIARAEFMSLQNRPIAEMLDTGNLDPSGALRPRHVHRKASRWSTPRPQLASQVHQLLLPFEPDPATGWRPHRLFRGPTPGLAGFACHVSVLDQGRSPHPPHRHSEEEILIVLAGEADLILPERKGTRESEPPFRLRAHQFVYYPAGYPHTLVGASREPVHYLMLKWMSEPTGITDPLSFGVFSPFETPAAVAATGAHPFQTHRLLKGHTRWLRRLRCHSTVLASRAGYEPHADAYDVIILVLEGRVETLGKEVGPNGVIFYAAGEQHGIHNPGEAMARYLVFEFHGQQSPPGTKGIARHRRAAEQPGPREPDPKKRKGRRSLWHKATDRKRWSRRLNRWFGRRGPT